jgi:hypothetical protein
MPGLTRRLIAPLLAGIQLTAAPAAGQTQPVDRLNEGRAALEQGDVPRAVAVADGILQADPRAAGAIALKIEALASARDWETALNAYDGYIAAGGEESLPLLRQVARATLREAVLFYPTLRYSALGRLACAGDREALLELRRPGTSRPDDVETLLLAARLGDDTALESLRNLSSNVNPGVRIGALHALQRLRDRASEGAALAALRSNDLFLRLAGARFARALGLVAAVPALEALSSDQAPLVAAEATATLAVLGSDVALERVRPLADSENPDIRLAAFSALVTRAPDARVLEGLAELARRRTGLSWIHAVELLMAHDPVRAAESLREALGDGSANVRVQALGLLYRMPAAIEPRDLATFQRLLRDTNTFVRVEAATALLGRSTVCSP